MFLASSLKDVYYILNRLSGDEKRARQDVCRVRKMFTVVPLTNDVVDDALASDEPDFEDALIRSCAEKHRCTAIITRDKKAYVQSSIPKFTASDWLKNQTRSNSLRAKHNMD